MSHFDIIPKNDILNTKKKASDLLINHEEMSSKMYAKIYNPKLYYRNKS